MTRLSIVSLLLATLTAAACSDNGGNNTGGAGQGGGAAGSGGGAAGSGGGGGPGGGSGGSTPTPFMSVAPCTAESMYVATPTTIDFGLLDGGFNYRPKCLKVATGTQVTFMSSSSTNDFIVHPLAPSANRGTRPGNPIVSTTTGTSAMFTFPTKGFWAYYCTTHGSLDDGTFMAGVIWAD
jgi:plastocyanin